MHVTQLRRLGCAKRGGNRKRDKTRQKTENGFWSVQMRWSPPFHYHFVLLRIALSTAITKRPYCTSY